MEMQTKTTTQQHFTLTRVARNHQRITSVGKDVEKMESPYTAGRKVNGEVTLENRVAVPQMMKLSVTQ